MILYILVIAIHVVASLVLIAVILLQAGRGGGLSETFGSSSTQTILGTKTSTFLKRATAVSAVVYILTCLTLAVMTSHRGRSLVATGGTAMPQAQMPAGGGVPFADDSVDF
ncbi:MAG: preprotein translocase subunit SecG [Candidatus Omnitrophica bacterium]|nr:preprotein translocase subunit SecG [Candidatus Omnitrophota bacterium]